MYIINLFSLVTAPRSLTNLLYHIIGIIPKIELPENFCLGISRCSGVSIRDSLIPQGSRKPPASIGQQGAFLSGDQEKRNGVFFPIKVTASRSLMNLLYHTLSGAQVKNGQILKIFCLTALASRSRTRLLLRHSLSPWITQGTAL